MPRYKLVVMTKPVEGREQEYNEWYQNVHLTDVVAIPGFRSAQRSRLRRSLMPDQEPLPYLAIYEIETNDIDAAVDELVARSQSGRMVISSALSRDSFAAVYEEVGPVVLSAER